MARSPSAAARPLTQGLRLLFLVATLLQLVAAIQLFVLSERTEHFFAWTVEPPLTAAVDGAFYLGAVLFTYTAFRERLWAPVRPLAYGVLTVSTLKLVATLLHTDRFHFDSPDAVPPVAAWGWLAVYVVVPLVLVALFIQQHRIAGGEPRAGLPFPSWFRVVIVIQSAVMLILAVALFLAPTAIAGAWPWTLTPLTARALAAWFAGIGVIEAMIALDNDGIRARVVMWSAILLAVLVFAALARYAGEVEWSRPGAAAFVVFFLSLLAAGAYGARLAAPRSD